MKISDRPSVVPQRKTSTDQAARPQKAVATTLVVAQQGAAETFAMRFSAAAPPSLGATGDILPTSVNPPTDERLTRALDAAVQEIFKGERFLTGPQRTNLPQVAKDMRARGRSAKEIQGDL